MKTEGRAIRFAAVATLAMLLVVPSWLAAQAPPAGATFKCKDGTYSTAATTRGACSRHGGVAQALTAAAPARAPAAAPAAAPTRAPARAAASAAAGVPAGAKFKCKDGTYSTAASPRGACSRHGGVAEALGAAAAAPAPPAAPAAAAAGVPAGAKFKCKDGTYSMAATPRGACSGHGGVGEALVSAAAAPAPPAAAAAPQAAAPAARAPSAAIPANAPENATALCKDGTYSMSQHRSGTCSRHGGVERWLRQPPN